MILTLILKEPAPKVITHLPLVHSLLKEFSDLSPDELPSELPPMREIQHQIELIPSSNMPNLPHYRSSLQEHEILQGIVDDLQKKKTSVREPKPICCACTVSVRKIWFDKDVCG